MESRPVASIWGLVAALVLALLAACADEGSGTKADEGSTTKKGYWGDGVYIGSDWALARAVSGHRLHVVLKKIECTKCHSMTESDIGPVSPERCGACHEKEARIQHGSAAAERHFGLGAKADCTSCHAFTFDGTGHDEALRKAEALRVPVDAGAGSPLARGIETYSPKDCKRCHETEQGGTPAVIAHGSQPCLTCHKPHDEPTPKSAPCSDCHEQKTTHAARGKTSQETCSTCHQHQHARASDALGTCSTCHATQEPKIPATALFENGHTECVGCHQPHQFEKSAATCKSCHEGLNVIGAARVPSHNTCTNCHNPHDVKASPRAACQNCHKGVHSDHPQQATGGCVGCHNPHPQRVLANVDARACSSCHQFARSDHAAHQGVECTGCHKPHAFQLALENLSTCAGCHAQRVQQVSTNAGHETCTNCHTGLPHRPETLAPGCAGCHTREGAAGGKNPGHTRCTQCHEPHSGAQQSACGACHKEEHRTAPAGHQDCASCHDPHSGAQKKSCTGCHAAEAQSPHGKVGGGTCNSCHRPHGPGGTAGPAACTTCHKQAELAGLHAEAKHQPCAKCHTGHGEQPGLARQACLDCHKDRTDHFPDAQRCASCHLFTKTR